MHNILLRIFKSRPTGKTKRSIRRLRTIRHTGSHSLYRRRLRNGPYRIHLTSNEKLLIQKKAAYYFGANTIADLFLLEQMHQFENDLPDFKFIPVVAEPESDQNWQGQTGLVTHAVQNDLKNAPQSEAYLCGSPAMIEACIKVLIELGMPEERIYYDKFA